MLKFECALVDGGVRNIIALSVLKHECQIRVNMFDTVILVAFHLVSVGNYGLSHLGRRGTEILYCTECVCDAVFSRKNIKRECW